MVLLGLQYKLPTEYFKMQDVRTQTAAIAGGGNFHYYRSNREYDGTTWTNNPTGLNTARA
jgi:hypothetical protein